MATISTIQNAYGSQLYEQISQKLASNNETTKTQNTSDTTNKTTDSKSTTQQINKSWLQLAVSSTLAGMGLGPNDKVTFSTILAYKDKLQNEFDTKVKDGLKKAGIDENAKFQLVSKEEGGINVITDHADKAKIEKFFEDNPELVKEFNKIQALNNVEESRKQQQLDVNAIRQRIQIESMTAWFAGTGSGVNSIMNFSGGGASFATGINTLV